MRICAPSPWPYHQLMNMYDHFTYCVTLAKQTVLEGGVSSSVQHEITVGKWCSKQEIKENALKFKVKQTYFNHKCSC